MDIIINMVTIITIIITITITERMAAVMQSFTKAVNQAVVPHLFVTGYPHTFHLMAFGIKDMNSVDV